VLRGCRENSRELEQFSNPTFTQKLNTDSYKVTNSISPEHFSASIDSESISREAMAKRYVMDKIREEMERTTDEELLSKFKNQQFNWIQADYVYRG